MQIYRNIIEESRCYNENVVSNFIVITNNSIPSSPYCMDGKQLVIQKAVCQYYSPCTKYKGTHVTNYTIKKFTKFGCSMPSVKLSSYLTSFTIYCVIVDKCIKFCNMWCNYRHMHKINKNAGMYTNTFTHKNPVSVIMVVRIPPYKTDHISALFQSVD